MGELAAFICGHVFDQSRPVLLVSHEGGDWQFLCGGDHGAGDTPRVVGINHLLDLIRRSGISSTFRPTGKPNVSQPEVRGSRGIVPDLELV